MRSVPELMCDTWQQVPCLTPALPSGYHSISSVSASTIKVVGPFLAPWSLIFRSRVLIILRFILFLVFEQKIHPKAEKLFLIKLL